MEWVIVFFVMWYVFYKLIYRRLKRRAAPHAHGQGITLEDAKRAAIERGKRAYGEDGGRSLL